MGALIDTSILIALDRGSIELQDLLNAFPDEEWFISTVTVSELLRGSLRTSSPARRAVRFAFVEDNISRFEVLEFDLPAARTHAEIWAELARHGGSVGERDLMIAATAVSRNYAVATRDLRSFPKIPGLTVLTL
jgi:tRNA(fMet)-specific endonuclease VapC